LNSSKVEDVFNDDQELNYDSIVEFIMMYEPQCDRDMLLIMYQEEDCWVFMTSEFEKDLKPLVNSDENAGSAGN
jgi:hypothetical protein